MANHLIRRDPQHPLGRFDPFSDMKNSCTTFLRPYCTCAM